GEHMDPVLRVDPYGPYLAPVPSRRQLAPTLDQLVLTVTRIEFHLPASTLLAPILHATMDPWNRESLEVENQCRVQGVQEYQAGRPMRLRNSARVALFVWNTPRRQLVRTLLFCFSTPRIIMHRWRASTATATPRGSRISLRAFAISVVSRS